jgi:hypothetical protein
MLVSFMVIFETPATAKNRRAEAPAAARTALNKSGKRRWQNASAGIKV